MPLPRFKVLQFSLLKVFLVLGVTVFFVYFCSLEVEEAPAEPQKVVLLEKVFEDLAPRLSGRAWMGFDEFLRGNSGSFIPL